MHRIARLAATVALGAAVVLGGTLDSGAAPGPSQVTVIHGIPGVNVDVYVNDALTLTDFAPGDQAGPLSLDAGTYAIKVFAHVPAPPASAAARVDSPVIDQSPAVPADADVSVIANLDAGGTPTLSAFVNDTAATAPGKGRVTVRHTAAAPTVDILVDGSPALTGLAYGAEASAELPAGTYQVAVRVSPAGPTVLDLGPVTVTAGVNLIVYATGSASAQPSTLGVQVQTIQVGQQQATTTTTTTTVPTTAPPTTVTTAPAPLPPAPVAVQPAYTG